MPAARKNSSSFSFRAPSLTMSGSAGPSSTVFSGFFGMACKRPGTSAGSWDVRIAGNKASDKDGHQPVRISPAASVWQPQDAGKRTERRSGTISRRSIIDNHEENENRRCSIPDTSLPEKNCLTGSWSIGSGFNRQRPIAGNIPSIPWAKRQRIVVQRGSRFFQRPSERRSPRKLSRSGIS